ncbi:MAG: PQQ-binding-like beta-propeller repeat protein [Planctomycetota bacterium]
MTPSPLRWTAALALSIGALTSFSGCAGDPVITAEQRIEALRIEAAAWRAMGYRWDWKVAPTVAPGEEPRSTTASDDFVVFQESGGSLTGFSAGLGERLWVNQLGNSLAKFTGTAIVGSQVYVTSESELFILDSTTGEMLDRQPFGQLVNTAPLISGNLVIVGTNLGELLGHFVPAGLKAWGHRMPGVFEQAPVRVGQVVGAVTTSGRVIFVDPVSRRQTGLNDIFDGPGAPLGSGDNKLFVASLDQSLYAFDPRDASRIWQHRTPDPVRGAPVFFGGVVYCSFREAGLTALDANTGDVLWSNPELRGDAVAIRNGRLMIFGDGRISQIDPQRGTILESLPLPNTRYISTDGFEDGDLYLTSDDGVIARLVPVG